jgi:hypothetical protein
MKTNLSVLYGLKEKFQLQKALSELQLELNYINEWFNSYNQKYSNSVMTKAGYDDPIRKPYNEMFDRYEKTVEQFRLAKYYLEIL